MAATARPVSRFRAGNDEKRGAEQYFCPIKHARSRAGAHERYRDFLDFGDGDEYKRRLAAPRAALREAAAENQKAP